MEGYEFLLDTNDSIRLLSAGQIADLKDYANMRERNLPTVIKWKTIRSNIVTKGGTTLWQLVEKFLNGSERPIGVFEPPISLIRWVMNNGKR